MLPANRRLARRYFLEVKKTGRTLHTSGLTVLFKPQFPALGHVRLGVVTSSRLSGKAVIRNRLRRLLHRALADRTVSLDLILIPKPALLKLDYEVILAEVNQALSKISVP